MGKYDQYICTELHKRHMLPGPTPEQRDALADDGLRISMEHVLWIDSDIIPGAYYGETTWIWPPSYPGQITPEELAKRTTPIKPMFPHNHTFPELLSWWGTNPDNFDDTSEWAMIMNDEEIPLKSSWVAYCPAGMMHMPKRIPGGKVTKKPTCHWTFGPGSYTRDKDGKTVEEKDEAAEAQKEWQIVPGKQDYRKYIIMAGDQQTFNKPGYMNKLDARYARNMAYIDNTVIPDAELGCDTMFLLPGNTSKSGMVIMEPHTLPHGTSITLAAMNYPDLTDLCAEVELWIGGEKHIIDKSFGTYIPPDVEQGPLIIRNIKQQIFFNMCFPVGKGIEKYPGR